MNSVRTLALAFLVVAPLSAQALVIEHSGYVLGVGDGPVSGTTAMRFTLWDDVAAGSNLWTGEVSASQACSVSVSSGYYSTLLGSSCGAAIPESLFSAGGPVWLQVEIGGVTLTPRQGIYSAPIAQAFAGTLTGDVTGKQGATVVASVGGASAANVATGTALANAATNANTASTLVKRDASGAFAAGTVTAGGLVLAMGAGLGKILTSDANGNASWGAAGAAGTAGGDLSGTYPNPTLATVGTAGTYTRVTVDAKGRVTGGTSLLASDVTSALSTALPVANGGTGQTTFPAHALLVGNAAGAIGNLAAGTTGQVLTINASGAPAWAASSGGTTSTVDANTTLLLHLDSSVADASASAVTIANNGPVGFSGSTAKFGSAAQFTGANYLSNTTTTVSSLNGSFTVDFWVNPSANGAMNGSFLIMGAGTSGGWGLATNPGTTTPVFIANLGAAPLFSSSTSLTLNAWSHLALVRSGTTVTLYLNGTSVGSGTWSGNYAGTGLYLGSFAGQAGSFYSGAIDELRISNLARYTSTFTPATTAYGTPAAGYTETVILSDMNVSAPSVNVYVPHFNSLQNVRSGTLISVASSSTLGASITALVDCTVAVDFSFIYTGGPQVGITLNASPAQKATNFDSTPVSIQRVRTGATANQWGSASATVRMSAGDVLTPHDGGYTRHPQCTKSQLAVTAWQ